MLGSRSFGFKSWLQWQPQRAVGALALLLALALCALVASNLERDYQQQVQSAVARNDSLVRLLEEHVRQSLRRVELTMSLSVAELQTQYKLRGRIDASAGKRLRSYLPADGLMTSLVVVNAKGEVVAASWTDNVADSPNLSDRDFFKVFSQPDGNGLFIGQAIRSRLSGQWIIPVSVRLGGDAGGVLVGAVDPEYFQHLYRSIDTGDNGFVTMLTTQGWAVARWPFSAEIAQKNWSNSPLFTEEIPQAEVGNRRRVSSATQMDTMYSYRALRDYRWC